MKIPIDSRWKGINDDIVVQYVLFNKTKTTKLYDLVVR